MFKTIAASIAATALAFTAVPAMAQDEPEEPRTTYSIEFLRFAPGKDGKWTEMQEKYFAPAAEAAGLPAATVHWLVDGQWDLMVVREMPRGMSMLDTHASPERMAWRDAYWELAGGEEAAKKMEEEAGTLIESSMQFYSHTHP